MYKEFVEQEDESVQDEYLQESPESKLEVGIGCFPNTDSYEVDTQPLFDDHFVFTDTRQQGVDDSTTTNLVPKDSKITL